MKKILAMSISVVLILTLFAGCGGSSIENTFEITDPIESTVGATDVMMVLEINGVAGQVDYIPQYEYEAIGWLLGTITIGKDGTINQNYSGDKNLLLKETWISGEGPGVLITLTEANIQGNFDASSQKGKGTLRVSWKFLEEGGAGLDYNKYDIKRTFEANFNLEPAYSEPNKSRGQMYLETYGKSIWDTTYTGKMYDTDKQEYYIGSEKSVESNEEWGGNYAFEIVKD